MLAFALAWMDEWISAWLDSLLSKLARVCYTMLEAGEMCENACKVA